MKTARLRRVLRSTPCLYALTVACAVAAQVATQDLPRVFGRLPFAPFMILGGVLTLYGGRGPGLLMTALGFVGTVWLRHPPVGPFEGLGAVVLGLPTVWFIDRHKRAVSALHDSERRYQRLCDLSNDMVLAGDRDGRIVSVNAAGASLVGYQAASLIGREILKLVVPADRERVAAGVRQLHAPGGPGVVSQEVNVLAADGTTRTVDVRSALRTRAGAVVGTYTLGRDVTERRRLEEELRQSQKMEAVGRLAGGVAHDFNNLLTAIMGFSTLALDGLGAAHPQAEDLRQVLKLCDRAAHLVRQLLAFSRRQVLEPIVIDPNAMLAELEAMLIRLIGPTVTLHTSRGADVGRIRVDPNQFTQVVLNLVVNARDAMPHGGRITIAIEAIQVSEGAVRGGVAVTPGPYVALTVADSGTGIDQRYLAHIFEPFFTTKPPGQGTGLGLATVYGIVKQSGGYIWVESALGRGTRFEIDLPRVEESVAAASAEPEPAALAGTETILVAEENLEVRQLAVEHLAALGYRVLSAADGHSALRLASRHEGRIDALLSDLAMSGLSGPELADRLRQERPSIRVLFMASTALSPTDRTRGDVVLIQKPFTPRRLAQALRIMLDRESQ